MKQLFKHFALLVMGALISGCAAEVEDVQPTTNGTVTMKTTISLSEQASTRALDINGNKTFAAGDQIAVVYEQESGTAKALSVALTDDDITNGGKDAAFTVTLSSPKANGKVRYIYPASMVADDVSAAAPGNDATIKWSNLNTQDGLLSSLESKLDLATFDGDMTAQGNLPKTATLANQLTIGKFIIKNSATNADVTNTIISLTIADGTNNYAITRTAAAGPIYVAMKPIASTQTFTINATAGTDSYYKSVTGNALEASKIYDVTVKTFQCVDLSKLTTNYTALDGEVLTGTLDVDNYPVKISIAAGATVTFNNLTINGVNDYSYQWAGITCEGDATIILADGSTNTVKGFYHYFPGIIVAEGYTLTISGGALGTGKLNASSHYYAAGIGGGHDVNCGNITINGGFITAEGGFFGAGIGGGKGSYGDSNVGKCGNITISGGNITSKCMGMCAGIGGGNYASASCGNITISGGEISAQGSDYGAGIGGGFQSACGNITINGGFITASGGYRGAGIGGGYNGACANITITIGVTMVKATKGGDAQHSIGKGNNTGCGTVTIGCTLNSDGTPNGGTTGYISDSPYTYPPSAAP